MWTAKYVTPILQQEQTSLTNTKHLSSLIILNDVWYCPLPWAAIAQSAKRPATGWTVRGTNPVGGVARFSAPVQTGPGAYPSSCTMGTGSFPGVKRPGRGAEQPPPYKCRGHERVRLYLYSPSGPSWPVIGRTFPFTFTVHYLIW